MVNTIQFYFGQNLDTLLVNTLPDFLIRCETGFLVLTKKSSEKYHKIPENVDSSELVVPIEASRLKIECGARV